VSVCLCVGCLDTLTTAHSVGLSAVVTDTDESSTATSAAAAAAAAVFTKDDYSLINRFESTSLHYTVMFTYSHLTLTLTLTLP